MKRWRTSGALQGLAVVTDTDAYVASPVELPWLKKKALDFRRSEMMDPPASEVVH